MFDAHIRDHAHLNPRAPAVITPGIRANYGQFDSDIDRFGAALAGLGVVRGCGVVSLRLLDPYLLCVATAALARLGIASSPSTDAGADLRLEDGDPGPPGPRRLHLDRDWVAAAFAAPHRPLPRLALDPDTVLRVSLSSGTTSVPRRVPLTAARIAAGSRAQLSGMGSGRAGGGAWIAVTGPDSAAGFLRPVSAWTAGAAFAAGLPIEKVPEWLEVLEPGVLTATPAQLRTLLAVLPADYQPQSRWRISTGGAMCPPALIREVRARITPDLVVNYGATEASINCTGRADPDLPPGQVGHPLAGCEIEVLDDDGRPTPAGVSGEIRIRSDRMAAGYLDDPEGTAARFRDGWFHPGDVGRLLPDGRLVIEGRTDDRLNVGNMKFLPESLELFVLEYAGVRDCAVFAVPDAQGMDQCWIAVASAPDFDRTALSAHLAQRPRLPSFSFAWVEAIPRNAMGKVERKTLREAVMALRRGDGG